MQELSPMPSIAVTIGGQLRVYHAFVTNAGPELDGPSTLTLYASTFSDLAGFAADPIAHDTARGCMTARLVAHRDARTCLAPRQVPRRALRLRSTQIPCSSASRRCGTGSGPGCRRQRRDEVQA